MVSAERTYDAGRASRLLAMAILLTAPAVVLGVFLSMERPVDLTGCGAKLMDSDEEVRYDAFASSAGWATLASGMLGGLASTVAVHRSRWRHWRRVTATILILTAYGFLCLWWPDALVILGLPGYLAWLFFLGPLVWLVGWGVLFTREIRARVDEMWPFATLALAQLAVLLPGLAAMLTLRGQSLYC